MAEWEWTCVCGQKLRTKAANGEALTQTLCAKCQEEADKAEGITEADIEREVAAFTAKRKR